MRVQLVAGGVALVAASIGCERKPEQVAAEPAASSSAISAVSAPVASQVATAGAGASARAPVDAGKGRIACGAASCRVGQEVCCVSNAGKRRCIPVQVPPPPPAAWDAETATWEACGHGDYNACDGPSDCGPSETCCEKEVWEPDDNKFWVQACVPTREGKIACSHAEICNEADSACKRPGATCIEQNGKRHVCAVPPRRRPDCGGSPCPDGSVCYERDGKRACQPAAGIDPSDPPEGAILCDRGSDCAPDEACWSLFGYHRCDRSWRNRIFPERALCVDVGDCAAACPGKAGVVASCHRDGEGVGICACHSKCTGDAECAKSEDCGLVSQERDQGNTPLTPKCDRRAGVCDCVAVPVRAKR